MPTLAGYHRGVVGPIRSQHTYYAYQAFPEPIGVEAQCGEAGMPRKDGKQEESYVVSIQLFFHCHHEPEEQPRAVLDLFLEGRLEVLGFSCAKSRGEADAAITTATHSNDSATGAPGTAKHSTAECLSASPKRVF